MEFSTIYRVNTPQVVGDVIDGEAIIIHLESGVYYSAREIATEIWVLIDQGASVGQIIESLSAQYEVSSLELSFALATFITELVTQKLIVPVPDAAPASITITPAAQKLPFTKPVLEIFRDMQNLLMLDPIHQVEPTRGWPAAPAENG
jgi:hypothetical protein